MSQDLIETNKGQWMLKDVSARKGARPYQSEDVGRSMIVTGKRVSKCEECKRRSHQVWAYVYLGSMSQHPIGVTYVASLLDQGLDGSWGRGRMVNICVEIDRASIFWWLVDHSIHTILLICRSHSACDGGAVFKCWRWCENRILTRMLCYETRIWDKSVSEGGEASQALESRATVGDPFIFVWGAVGAERYRGRMTSGYRR